MGGTGRLTTRGVFDSGPGPGSTGTLGEADGVDGAGAVGLVGPAGTRPTVGAWAGAGAGVGAGLGAWAGVEVGVVALGTAGSGMVGRSGAILGPVRAGVGAGVRAATNWPGRTRSETTPTGGSGGGPAIDLSVTRGS